jgi:hypothetical protein
MTNPQSIQSSEFQNPGGNIVCRRAAWIEPARWLVFLCIAGLNISLPMSLIERALYHAAVQWGPEFVQFLFLFFCDMYFLPSCLLEPRLIEIRGDKMEIATILWRSKLSISQDVISLKAPRGLTWGILKTRRCFYLINRNDIKNFDHLASVLGQKLTSLTPGQESDV